MPGLRKLLVSFAGAGALVLIAVGVTYLAVDARSLPTALGRIPGSSSHRTVRGMFAVMAGGLVLLVAIILNQLRPGGALSAVQADGAQRPAAATQNETGDQLEAEPDTLGKMDDEPATDPILERETRRREERRAVEEAGGGEAEGFELAEADLIEHASHGDEHSPAKIMRDAVGPDEEAVDSVSGESDAEHLPD